MPRPRGIVKRGIEELREGKTKEEERKSEFEKHEEKWEKLIFEWWS